MMCNHQQMPLMQWIPNKEITKQDFIRRLAWHFEIHRFCPDVFFLSGMNNTDANFASHELDDGAHELHLVIFLTVHKSPDKPGSEVFRLILITGIYRQVIMQSEYTQGCSTQALKS